jgi:flagellin
MRANLASLQQTAALMGSTQERLSTGKKINSALDDPAKFFAAQNHLSRAADLERLKSGMDEGIQTLKAADKGIKGVLSLLEQMRGVATSALTASDADRVTLQSQYDEMVKQADDLLKDSGYKGVNLLNSGTSKLTVEFETGKLEVTGANGTSAAGGKLEDVKAAKITATGEGETAVAAEINIAAAMTEINDAIKAFRTQASTLAANISIITTRQEFTTDIADVLKTGAAKLTEADTNEEGANMLALQTRQQLGIISLQLASQSAQGVLRLF